MTEQAAHSWAQGWHAAEAEVRAETESKELTMIQTGWIC